MLRSEVDLYCPICQDVFSDPVLLACSHSFCSACVQTWWQDKALRLCPLCMQKSPPGEPPRNLALRNLCEAFLLERQERCDTGGRCRLHAERLRLFCADHREPACLVCRDSEVHAGHRFQTVDEAAQEQRKGLRLSVQPLRDQLKLFEETRGNWRDAGEYIRAQAGLTEAHIREHFKKLRQFLQAEEEARVAALREEEEQTSRKLKEAIAEMSASIDALSETIGFADEQLRADDIAFLQSLANTEAIVQGFGPLDDPPPARGALIDMAKHLGNLIFAVWSKMKMKEVVSYSPVVLDPNSAHPELVFSEDLSHVRCGERQELPANPERFQVCRSVLGSEGFDSGIHSWDVEVGGNPVWAVGVASESVDRKHAIESGLWSIMFNEGQYTAFSPGPNVHLPLSRNPRRVRVELNWSRGKLTFTDPDSNTHIHTFRHTFTERLFPILRTNNHLPLSIVAVKDPPGSKANSWWSLFR